MSENGQFNGIFATVQTLAQITRSTGSIQKEAEKIISDTLKQYAQVAENLGESLTSTLADTMSRIIGTAREVLSEIQMSNLALLGAYEWCVYSVMSAENKELNVNELITRLNQFVDDNDKLTREEVDEYVSSFFPDKVIEHIEMGIKEYLSEADCMKLDRAILHYREGRYYEAATLLTGLIDSYNIKQNLIDAENGGNQNVGSHGWKAFSIAFDNNFTDRFKGKSFNVKGNSDKQKAGFQEFVDEVKPDWKDNELLIPYVNLAYCLLELFDDSAWKTYPQKKPTNLNRNWLMHGMYDLGDVTEIDCKKLFLILNRLAALYSTLPDCA